MVLQSVQSQRDAAVIFNRRRAKLKRTQAPRTSGGNLGRKFPKGRRPMVTGDRSLEAARVGSDSAARNERDLEQRIARDIETRKSLHLKRQVQNLTKLEHSLVPPRSIRSLAQTVERNGLPEERQALEEFREEQLAIAIKDRRLGSGNIQARKNLSRDLSNAAKKFETRRKNIQAAIKATRTTKDIGWHLLGRGGIVESEGVGLWSWFGTGVLISMYQSIKMFVLPKGTGKLDDGQLVKGFLSFLEPNRPDSILSGIITGFYSMLGWFALLFMFLLLNGFIAIIAYMYLLASNPLETISSLLFN